MKKLLFCVPLMMLLTSCGGDGSLLRVPNNSLGLACFALIGLGVGAVLGFAYALMPRRNLFTGAYSVHASKKKSVLYGALITGVIAYMAGLVFWHP